MQAVTRRIVLGLGALLAGCAAELGPADLQDWQYDDEPGEEELESYSEPLSCQPLMSVAPVRGPHNIGWDRRSCGTGTCVTSCPDAHANSDWGGPHHGIDVFATMGAPLVAVADGTITAVGTPSRTSGLRVRLRDACGWEYYYGHLDTATVRVGQRVSAGDVIGTMGRTGTSSVHLHFNVSPRGDYYADIDPFPLLQRTSPTACGATATPAPTPTPTPTPAPAPTAGCGALPSGAALGRGEAVGSCDGRFTFVHQLDGNVVLYQAGRALWSSGTAGRASSALVMQPDGNLVLYDAGGRALWHTHTHGHPGASLAVQSDGNVVIYAAGRALWHTQTCCR
jgi:hypothetical protein